MAKTELLVEAVPQLHYYVNGTLLRELRLKRGPSLRSLAKHLKISPAYVSRIENARGRTPISKKLAERIQAWGR